MLSGKTQGKKETSDKNSKLVELFYRQAVKWDRLM